MADYDTGNRDPGNLAPGNRDRGAEDRASEAVSESQPWQELAPMMVLRRPGRRSVWTQGNLSVLSGQRIAVIGSRTPTADHVFVAERLCTGLAQAGAVICSGGALGIDAVAHRSTLRAGGLTVLVSPVAAGDIYPKRHGALYSQINAEGLIISPFSPETAFHRSQFRTRNTILARLVDAVIVICADLRSGSLHCAREAWRLGVPVLAVPWSPGTTHAAGTNLLLHAGARAISTNGSARQLVVQLRQGASSQLLRRDDVPPTGAAKAGAKREGTRPSGKTQSATSAQLVLGQPDIVRKEAIDGGDGRWQRYAPIAHPGLTPTGAGMGEAMTPNTGETVDNHIRRCVSYGAVTLEQLISKTGHPRAAVAELLLHWTLTGQVQRDAWGRYHTGSRASLSD
ncbi:MAG: DNA-processing protein DprA [Myxococcales bacterium]|nr:DNA-processing protein DprA [Myxococcales bacterium]